MRAAYHVERERLGKGAAFDAAVSRVRLLAGEQGVKAASRKDAAVAGKFSPFVVQFVARVFPEWPLPKLARRVAKALAAEKCPIFILAKGSELSTVCSDVGNEVKMQDTATATDLLRHLGESLAALAMLITGFMGQLRRSRPWRRKPNGHRRRSSASWRSAATSCFRMLSHRSHHLCRRNSPWKCSASAPTRARARQAASCRHRC